MLLVMRLQPNVKGHFMAFNMVKDYKNKALQATVSYFKDTNDTVYRSNTINWVLMAITWQIHTSNATLRYSVNNFLIGSWVNAAMGPGLHVPLTWQLSIFFFGDI